MTSIDDILFPLVEPFDSGSLCVDEVHVLYWEQAGRRDGVPAVYLHGGPGSGCDEGQRFFDPGFYRVISFDQRGAKRSRPLGELGNNTPAHLVSDLEALRERLRIDRWHVFGGSWGSTLALLYARAHPDRCLSLLLRGISFFEKSDLHWWFQGMGAFFPELWEELAAIAPEDQRHDLLPVYHALLASDDETVREKAARAMHTYGRACGALLPSPSDGDWRDPLFAAQMSAFYKIFAHYCKEHKFEEGELLRGIERIRGIPAVIVQGRHDVVCPPMRAYQLHQTWPEAGFDIVADGGHSSREPALAAALVRATEAMKSA